MSITYHSPSLLHRTGIMVLDGAHYGGEAWLLQNPTQWVQHTPRTMPQLQHALEHIMQQLGDKTPTMQRVFCGVIAYEAGVLADDVPVPHQSPLIMGAIYEAANVQRTTAPLQWSHTPVMPACGAFAPYFTRPQFADAVSAAQEHIRAGDIFQVNLCQSLYAALPSTTSPAALAAAAYLQWQRHNAAPYGAYLALPNCHVVSCSPELFLSITPDGHIATEPIKGTAPLTTSADALAAYDKDRAENIMIADLMRNDLSRVCVAGSVQATQVCAVRNLPNLRHLYSRIEGQIASAYTLPQVLCATLPPGSVTGAPKRRASQIIAALEGVPRGWYCGAIGYITNNGEAMFNVAIRTMVIQNSLVRIQAGSGITLKSDPMAEYHETNLKMQRLLQVFGQ